MNNRVKRKKRLSRSARKKLRLQPTPKQIGFMKSNGLWPEKFRPTRQECAQIIGHFLRVEKSIAAHIKAIL